MREERGRKRERDERVIMRWRDRKGGKKEGERERREDLV
jgi:hypothetical protein